MVLPMYRNIKHQAINQLILIGMLKIEYSLLRLKTIAGHEPIKLKLADPQNKFIDFILSNQSTQINYIHSVYIYNIYI